MTGPAVVVDDWALEAVPGLERELARAGALVMRSFRNLPNPALLRAHPGAAVVGGPDRTGLLARLETATSTLVGPVIAILPPGVAPAAELRGPGVVDLVPAGSPRVAERILLMARVPIVSGRAAARPPAGAAPAPAAAPPRRPLAPPGGGAPGPDAEPPGQLVAVASSTGGVWVLAALLRELPPRGRAVLVAQHMDAEFVPFLAEWLRSVSGWRTEVVTGPVACAAGTVHLAAGGLDLVAEPGLVRGVPASARYVPSADRLLRTVATAAGAAAVGVVLSGMGSDGAEGLAELARRGGRALCQDPASAIVPSMPEHALRRTAGALALPPEALAAAVVGVAAAGTPGGRVAAVPRP